MIKYIMASSVLKFNYYWKFTKFTFSFSDFYAYVNIFLINKWRVKCNAMPLEIGKVLFNIEGPSYVSVLPMCLILVIQAYLSFRTKLEDIQ